MDKKEPMKIIISVALFVCGLGLLCYGLGAEGRQKKEQGFMDQARIEVEKEQAQRDGDAAAAEEGQRYTNELHRSREGLPPSHETLRNELAGAQLKPYFKTLNNQLEDLSVQKTAALVGAMQCYTGVLVMAAGCVVLAMHQPKNSN